MLNLSNFSLVEEPWPHLLIRDVIDEDLAQYMMRNWPKSDWGKEPDFSPAFPDFTWGVFDQSEEITDFISNHLPIQKTKISCVHFYEFSSEEETEVRGWHLDSPYKAWNSIIYLGSGPNSALELKGDPNLSYEYEHNRMVIWNDSRENFHRFSVGCSSRKTISISADKD